ncbi:MAG: 4'-phosphopantetheinyl transferase superfamily protein [Bacteroidales bacterium]
MIPEIFYKDICGSKILLSPLIEDIQTALGLVTLSQQSMEEFNNIQNPLRQREWISVRWLLKEYFGEPVHVSYKDSGSPYIKTSKTSISISHSKKMVGIACNEIGKSIGIDIEMPQNRILNVKPRIIRPSEMFFDPEQEIEYLTLIWSAKESAYKLIGQSDLLFFDIIIFPFHILESGGIFSGEVYSKKGKYNLSFYYFYHLGNYIVFCTEY